jgi:hypothetical protein
MLGGGTSLSPTAAGSPSTGGGGGGGGGFFSSSVRNLGTLLRGAPNAGRSLSPAGAQPTPGSPAPDNAAYFNADSIQSRLRRYAGAVKSVNNNLGGGGGTS